MTGALMWCTFRCTGHGIAQEDFDRVLLAGQQFLALPEADKTKWPFNPDTYLGHRGSKELETVTGEVTFPITVNASSAWPAWSCS